VDNRPDGIATLDPKPETLKEISGLVLINLQGINELGYNNEQQIDSISSSGISVSSSCLIQVPKKVFSEGGMLVRYHTHPMCDPLHLHSKDIKSFKEIVMGIKDLKAEDCFDVVYVSKTKKFYWYALKQRGELT